MRAAEDKDIDQAIGSSIRRQRLRKRLSQTELGRAIGVSFQQIQKYESGANRIAAARLLQIARTLRVPLPAFFAGIENTGGGAATPPQSLVDQRQAARLMAAFTHITSPKLRSRLLNLVEQLP